MRNKRIENHSHAEYRVEDAEDSSSPKSFLVASGKDMDYADNNGCKAHDKGQIRTNYQTTYYGVPHDEEACYHADNCTDDHPKPRTLRATDKPFKQIEDAPNKPIGSQKLNYTQ